MELVFFVITGVCPVWVMVAVWLCVCSGDGFGTLFYQIYI